MSDTSALSIKKVKDVYKNLKTRPIFCPAIQCKIVFNRHGWNHLFFDGNGHRRNRLEINKRLSLFLFAQEVIENASAPPTRVETRLIKYRGNTRQAIYWEVSCAVVVDGKKRCIQVIVRQLNHSRPHYFSIKSKETTKKP